MVISKSILRCWILGLEIIVCFLTAAVMDARAADVTLAWDPNAEPDLAGYKIHYGTASGSYSAHIDVGNVTKYKLTGLTAGKTYFFAATAYDAFGYESAYSTQAIYSVPGANVALSAPTPPSGATTATTNSTVTFSTSSSVPNGDGLQYRFDWGGGVLSLWGSTSQSHSWSASGQYAVRAQARDSLQTESAWSAATIVTVIDPLRVSTDADGDGLPNPWEVMHNLNWLVNDALEDADNDGFCNLREYLSGSDPQLYYDQPSILADFENDNDVDGSDLAFFIRQFGRTGCDSAPKPCEFDLDTDGDVDVIDLRLVIEDYGRSQNYWQWE
jgi:hypothetical protein